MRKRLVQALFQEKIQIPHSAPHRVFRASDAELRSWCEQIRAHCIRMLSFGDFGLSHKSFATSSAPPPPFRKAIQCVCIVLPD